MLLILSQAVWVKVRDFDLCSFISLNILVQDKVEIYTKTSDLISHLTAQKIKFSIKDFFSKYHESPHETADLVAFTEEILNGKLHFLSSVSSLRTG